MSDLGDGPSVADALLGTDPAAAADAVVAWARALAGLHGATAGLRAEFAAALRAGQGDWPVAECTMESDLDDAAYSIAKRCADLGIDVPARALDELRRIVLRGPAALTPSDTCPDNNVRTADGLALIDFEGAQWRPVGWDVAYLRVPWPSCWCAWRLPDDVTERALAAYRAESTLELSTLDSDLSRAVVAWAFVTTSWFLGRALAEDRPWTPPDKPMPRVRAFILHRLAQAADERELTALAELAGRMRAALADRWGELPLPYAPAFTT
jgi:hypothetical protein